MQSNDAKPQNNALDRPVNLAPIDASRTIQTPITPPFTQANVAQTGR
jgi:hypothetical protein